jgi:hypothetical protein
MNRLRPRLLIFLCGVLLSALAAAADGTLTWTLPTQCADGTPISNCALNGIRIERKLGATGTWATRAIVGPTVTTYVDVGLPVGVNYWRLFSISVSGISVPTNEVSKDVLAPLPGPPGNLAVQIAIVYNVVKQIDRFVLVPVGTAPLATACISTQYVNGYHVVPRNTVTWYGSVQPAVVVAQCG